MPTFITIGYGDRDAYDCTPESVREAAHGLAALLSQPGDGHIVKLSLK